MKFEFNRKGLFCITLENGVQYSLPAEIGHVIQGLIDAQEDKLRLTRELDVALHGEAGAAKQASLWDLVGPAQDLRKRLDEACERLYDMLLADDGEAWSQAERFLKQHRPDLYNRLHVEDKLTPDLFEETPE